ncbi:MAG: GGDEF domain-containing protein [Lysobacteraceae bacterium]
MSTRLQPKTLLKAANNFTFDRKECDEMGRNLSIFLLSLTSFFSASSAYAADSFEATLQEADKVRSAYPKQFSQLLKRLQIDEKKATPSQRARLKYLQAYELGVYRDSLDEGIVAAKQVYDGTRDITLRYRAGSLIANFSAIKRDFGTGLRYLEKTLPLRTKIKDKSIRHDGIGVAAMLHNQIGQYEIGGRYAKEILNDTPEGRARCAAGHFRIESDFELGTLAKNDAPILAVVDQCISQHEFIPANLVRATLAKKWASEGHVEKAVALLEKILPDVDATQYPRLIAEVHSVLAELKLKQNDVVSAGIHANATIQLGEKLFSSTSLVSAYRTLYEIAELRGEPVEALNAYRRYAEADKAHLGDVKARELAYEIVRQETQQKNKEIELLQQNNKLLRTQQALEREGAQKARLAMVFLMLILTGIIFWVIQIKRHQGQLQRLAQTDTLTGLGNRHFFTQRSERALIDAARAGEPAALVMFDLDHFKAINDTYGHGAGDWVLKQVGKTCSSHCRKVDYLGRIGGEEFAVLLHGLDLSTAARLAEDCRSQLAQIDTRECGYSFVVTASFGVSSTAQSGYDLSRLLSHADQMLYRAKNEGRNRVCAYNAETAADYKSPKRAPTLSVVGG